MDTPRHCPERTPISGHTIKLHHKQRHTQKEGVTANGTSLGHPHPQGPLSKKNRGPQRFAWLGAVLRGLKQRCAPVGVARPAAPCPPFYTAQHSGGLLFPDQLKFVFVWRVAVLSRVRQSAGAWGVRVG
jgi:hypothetical protein